MNKDQSDRNHKFYQDNSGVRYTFNVNKGSSAPRIYEGTSEWNSLMRTSSPERRRIERETGERILMGDRIARPVRDPEPVRQQIFNQFGQRLDHDALYGGGDKVYEVGDLPNHQGMGFRDHDLHRKDGFDKKAPRGKFQ